MAGYAGKMSSTGFSLAGIPPNLLGRVREDRLWDSPDGRYKINTDGAVCIGSSAVTTGGVIRDVREDVLWDFLKLSEYGLFWKLSCGERLKACVLLGGLVWQG
ncbi:hypothetical protein PVK06_023715 [Gossypium arboreum]|uniref:Uncharacterized protein n=1 Tax=Gossypium arboreum TaxID=29729 RepID=A0ABR0PC75_GOSAR|nr:hypothetical protein PVK06_023715 [Gossypium arboreum]